MELLGSMPDMVKFIIVFLLILGVLAPIVWRWLNLGPFGHTSLRGRRLSVVEMTAVDVRHKLVLVKRDNVEHLLLIGGTANVVVESNIARLQAAREPRPIPDGRPEAARQAAAAETPDWSLPMEPSMARPVRTVDLDAALPEPPARTAREAMVDSMRAVRSVAAARRGPPMDLDNPPEEIAAPALAPSPSPADGSHRTGPEPRRAEPQRPQSAPEVVPPAVDAAPESRSESKPEPKRERTVPPPPRPVPPAPAGNAPPSPRPVQPAPAAASAGPAQPPRPTPTDEGNFAEMAQRLEAALRRPTPSKPETPPPMRSPLRSEQQPAGRRPAPVDAAGPAKSGVKSPDTPPPDLKVLPGKGKKDAALESLEDEMARMLGRHGKS